MKKTQKILGLPIISISDGLEVGRVKSIIINADRGAIDYIVVDSGIQIFSARVIPTQDVLGIGEYALTIENNDVITDISKIPAAIQLLQNDIRVKGTKVLTKKGRLIGEIGDIYIDDNDNCRITGLEFIADITQKQIKLIPRDSVITFGKNLTVVKEDIEVSLLDTAAQLDSEPGIGDFEKKNNSYIAYPASLPDEYAEPAATAEPQQTVSEEDNASVLFEQRQRQYLKGRYATKTIVDNTGSVIISEGMQIDDAIIDEAKAKDKLIELVMNNRA
ncbi:MAG TPA: PRC-barrel domain-containing protein [Clostridia bacterium]|nr:PRC-barrel domain-containing protein [Clostridia bacterium]